jgi:putative Holliday junction resolvase
VQRLSRELGESVPVEMYDERFTTRMAQRMQDTTTDEDSRAAAHLLEGWLMARNRERSSTSSR